MGRIAHSINRLLGLVGLRVTRVGTGKSGALSFDDVFQRLSERGISLTAVIDIGASNGRWSAKLAKYFPNCRFHLIEANAAHLPALKRFAERNRQISFSIAAASDAVGEVYFDDSDPLGGIASHKESEDTNKKVPSTTVDEEVSRLDLSGPYLLKLDTHGFEVPILCGAEKALQETSAIIVEAYNYHLNDDSLVFWELCGWLHNKGFRPADLLEPMHRPKDGMFWQVDIVFLRSDRPEFNDNRYD